MRDGIACQVDDLHVGEVLPHAIRRDGHVRVDRAVLPHCSLSQGECLRRVHVEVARAHSSGLIARGLESAECTATQGAAAALGRQRERGWEQLLPKARRLLDVLPPLSVDEELHLLALAGADERMNEQVAKHRRRPRLVGTDADERRHGECSRTTLGHASTAGSRVDHALAAADTLELRWPVVAYGV
jgi:hypothetical protein